MSGSSGPWKTLSTASALSSPLARKKVLRAASRTPGSSVTRGPGGTTPVIADRSDEVFPVADQGIAGKQAGGVRHRRRCRDAGHRSAEGRLPRPRRSREFRVAYSLAAFAAPSSPGNAVHVLLRKLAGPRKPRRRDGSCSTDRRGHRRVRPPRTDAPTPIELSRSQVRRTKASASTLPRRARVAGLAGGERLFEQSGEPAGRKPAAADIRGRKSLGLGSHLGCRRAVSRRESRTSSYTGSAPRMHNSSCRAPPSLSGGKTRRCVVRPSAVSIWQQSTKFAPTASNPPGPRNFDAHDAVVALAGACLRSRTRGCRRSACRNQPRQIVSGDTARRRPRGRCEPRRARATASRACWWSNNCAIASRHGVRRAQARSAHRGSLVRMRVEGLQHAPASPTC